MKQEIKLWAEDEYTIASKLIRTISAEWQNVKSISYGGADVLEIEAADGRKFKITVERTK